MKQLIKKYYVDFVGGGLAAIPFFLAKISDTFYVNSATLQKIIISLSFLHNNPSSMILFFLIAFLLVCGASLFIQKFRIDNKLSFLFFSFQPEFLQHTSYGWYLW